MALCILRRLLEILAGTRLPLRDTSSCAAVCISTRSLNESGRGCGLMDETAPICGRRGPESVPVMMVTRTLLPGLECEGLCGERGPA